MNKICTSLEQSKKLIELGIDVNTADMCWSIDIPDLPTLLAYPITDYDNWENKIPAWSLTALMGLMPKSIISTPNPFSENYCCRNIEFDMEFYADNPVDAAFEMVCWLKENKKI